MPEQRRERFPHLIVSGSARSSQYTSPRAGRKTLKIPSRDRRNHGQLLKQQLEEAVKPGLIESPDQERPIKLEFRSDPGFDLAIQSLESRRAGIELLSVSEADGVTVATVRVPEGKIGHFTKILEAYLDRKRDTKKGNPRHKSLVESIAEIRRFVLRSLWTERDVAFPPEDQPTWWELWLRDASTAALTSFRRLAAELKIPLSEASLEFPDRRVLLGLATPEQLRSSAELLDSLAELRLAKETADEFLSLSPQEQAEWARDLARRVIPAQATDAAVVCILDTGVNNGHVLIGPALAQDEMFAYDPAWGTADHRGHGTEMAGLALYGDLAPVLASGGVVSLVHRLESVKILPPPPAQNAPALYGAVTLDAVGQVETAWPTRPRIFSLAITTTDSRDRGLPSSWSAEIDQIASGRMDERRRLLCVAAGNADPTGYPSYIDSNLTDGIHDPGQAWNALTVGALTDRVLIKDPRYAGWTPLAPAGDLSPCSTTSYTWRRWPLKPDVVVEGGNAALDPGGTQADHVDSLSLLTTYWRPAERQFDWTGQTSAATAQAARMAAIVQSQYRGYWPETIRGLLVHSARWTPAMVARFPDKQDRERMMRCYGYGVPNLDAALWSARNDLTLIIQSALQPYDKVGSAYTTRDMHLHSLPWPSEALSDLGETPVELRVTLSYFIEPSPGRRGWTQRYRYASHGLRFDVQTAVETPEQFLLRLNKAARDEESGMVATTSSDAKAWDVGPALRSLGCVHSDIWRGTAEELAARNHVGIFPVIGWWRERPHLGRWNMQARYSLIVSIRAPEIPVDLYTPVALAIGIRPEIQT